MDPDTPPGSPILAGAQASPIRSLFLLADSQLLFWKDGGALFLERVRAELGPAPPRAAYLGASNGDVPEFYEIFVAAMEGIGVGACRMIPASPSAEDRAFLEEASVILLAGGDAARGMRAFQESGLAERILARYAAGAVLIGVSAGAVQLGQRIPTGRDGGDPHTPGPAGPDEGSAHRASMDGFRLVPLLIGVHEEPEWAALGERVAALEGSARGIGIPSGSGAVVHPDLSVEPVRKTLVEVSLVDGAVRHALLWPGRADARSTESGGAPT